MTVRLYLSTDASAPSLTGTVGSLVSLLDAVLVNGYGTQTAAGWTTAFTGTNKRDYKQGTGSNGYYLDIDDSGPGAGGAKEARLRGYEAMTALSTGTLPFPTTAQSATFGVVCRKSNTADSTSRPWYIVADATCFHLFVDTGDLTSPNYSMCVSFGDIFSYKSGDTYNTVLIGRTAENSGSNGAEAMPIITGSSLAVSSIPGGHYMDRHYNGIGGSVAFQKYGSIFNGGTSNALVMGGSLAVLGYPNGPDNALELSQIFVGHSGCLRGYLKGLWSPCHYQPCSHGDTFSGTGNMSGKAFLALNVQSSLVSITGSSQGQIIIETSNTWS